MQLFKKNQIPGIHAIFLNYGKSCKTSKPHHSSVFLVVCTMMLFALIGCRKEKEKEEFFSEFNKTYGTPLSDGLVSIAESQDGGYVVLGDYGLDEVGSSGSDAWISKIDKNGNEVWRNLLGRPGIDHGLSIISTPDRGYLMAGITYQGSNNYGVNHDVWLVKLNENGSVLWQKILGGSTNDQLIFPNSSVTTSDDGYIIAATSKSNDRDVSGNHGGYDIWLVKVNNNGDIKWQKSFGGSDNDFATSITAAGDGKYFLTGYSQSNDGDVASNKGYTDVWVLKVDASGNIIWQKSFGGTGNDLGYAVKKTLDGGCIVAGQTNTNNRNVGGFLGGPNDALLAKFDANGTLQWQKTLGSSQEDQALSVITTTDGGYIMCGVTNGNDGDVSGNHGNYDVWFVKLSSNGTMIQQKTLGGSGYDEFFSMMSIQGGYILAGETGSNDGDVSGNHGGVDGWIIKTRNPF